MDSCKCQTATASPAEPGELPFGLGYRSQPLGVEYKGLIEFADKARRKTNASGKRQRHYR
jgi:hypothetical protein